MYMKSIKGVDTDQMFPINVMTMTVKIAMIMAMTRLNMMMAMMTVMIAMMMAMTTMNMRVRR